MFSHETAKSSILSPKSVLRVKMLNFVFFDTNDQNVKQILHFSTKKVAGKMLKNQDATKIQQK